jgi:poly(A) polymerase
MSQIGMPTDRSVYRYFRDIGETGIDVLYLSLADHLATRGPGLIPENWREHTRQVDYVIRRHNEKKYVIRPPKIIDGYDIINRFNLQPGPGVGKALEAVREAQASGEVNSRKEALAFVGKYLAEVPDGKGEQE